MKPEVSIIISSFNRLPLFKRTLWSIANRPPSKPFEVIIVDDGSTEDVLGAIKTFSASFHWKFIRFDQAEFTKKTGFEKFFNNPSITNNIGFKNSSGELIFLQGNEIIAYGDIYDVLIKEKPNEEHFLAFSTTFDLPQEVLDNIGVYGTEFSQRHLNYVKRWPLQTKTYRSDVTNYISLSNRATWEAVGGYDERYIYGIGKEDSDFVRRCRAIPGWSDEKNLVRSEAISLHQYHGGRTCYYLPKPEVVTQEKWKQGETLSRPLYDSWDGSCKNSQPWPWGEIGVTDIISNF